MSELILDDVETNLNLTFPLPYRVLVLLGLGILAWATNLHGLRLLKVDPVSALSLRVGAYSLRNPISMNRTDGHGYHVSPSVLYFTLYKIFFAYGAFCLASWTVFRLCTKSDRMLIDSFAHIPLITGLVLAIVLICPMNVFLKHERDKFLYTLYRCLFPPSDAPIQFSDVVFADIATSFAKVLGDVWLSLAMLLPGNSVLLAPSEEGWYRWILPTIMSLPYFVRFRQCITEYRLPFNDDRRSLLNALKYATAFPVIFLSAAQKGVPVIDSANFGEDISGQPWRGTFRLWLFAAAVNSIYSFWWDITNDWGLDMLRPQELSDSGRRTPPRQLLLGSHTSSPLSNRASLDDSVVSEEPKRPCTSSRPASPNRRPYPWGLRSILLYPLPVYPLLMFLNLILRMTWSIKLSSHLYSVSDGGMGIFWLEVAEIIRRWLWVFIRVEWEVIKNPPDAYPKVRHDGFSGEERYEMFPTSPEQHSILRHDV